MSFSRNSARGKQLAFLVGALLLTVSSLALAHDSKDGGRSTHSGQMMGGQMMGAPGMHHGPNSSAHHLMHGGMMHGGMMQGGMMQGPDGKPRTFTLDEVEILMAAALVLEGNPRLRVGAVTLHQENEALVEILLEDGALVDRILVDRQTLRHWRLR